MMEGGRLQCRTEGGREGGREGGKKGRREGERGGGQAGKKEGGREEMTHIVTQSCGNVVWAIIIISSEPSSEQSVDTGLPKTPVLVY